MIDIIIPTFNNAPMLDQCLKSIGNNQISLSGFLNKIIVVNNGHADSLDFITKGGYCLSVKIDVVQMKTNVGWEGGLKAGLDISEAEYVVFMNDDVYVPQWAEGWLTRMVRWFVCPDIAAVGPSTNVVMGQQNSFITDCPYKAIETTFLIGFCMMVRRKHLDEVGGVPQGLPGGDDLDLSMRFTKAGYRMICARDVYVHHHGFQTGERVHGDHWNSRQMQDDTTHELIRRNGFRSWYACVSGFSGYKPVIAYHLDGGDIEGDAVRRMVLIGETLELGCGAVKTVEGATGVDIIKGGDPIPYLGDAKSVADYQADVTGEMPLNGHKYQNIIARHILEHCINPIETLRMWSGYLSDGGQLIVAVPDQRRFNTLPMNPEHVHGFTPESLDSFAEAAGLKTVGFEENEKSISFIKAYEKI